MLRAIFGEKSREVRDTSLCVPPGVEGTIVDVKIFSRSGMRKDRRYKQVVAKETLRLESEFAMHRSILEKMLAEKIRKELHKQKPKTKAPESLLTKDLFDAVKLQNAPFEKLCALRTQDKEINDVVVLLKERFDNQLRILQGLQEEQINRLKKGDPLPSGVIKMVKVYIAMKRPIQAGDKIAGRHGNKGVVSLIVPREDMPYMEDGTPVDVVLNPLGVPSRMNIGQILETILGYAGFAFGRKFEQLLQVASEKEIKNQLGVCYGAEFTKEYEKTYGKDGLMDLARVSAQQGVLYRTPVFDGADYQKDIKPILDEAGVPDYASFRLRDGRTGQFFDQHVTVGNVYMMKLNHMVDDKLHARSVGPYSLVTQQPLGGKAQMGGQRLGEMEVWALEAYGAAYTLQEMLTYKSDDVTGRHKVYEAIVRGEEVPEPGLPESFNVLIKELQSLGLRIDLFKSGKEEVSAKSHA